MSGAQTHCLRWTNYFEHLKISLESYRNNAEFADVTLCCEGQTIHAHKVVLSLCSDYFKEIFKQYPHPHPLLIFNLTKFNDLNSIIKYMYLGEVVVHENTLESFFQIAELLSVHGLTAEMENTFKKMKMQKTNPAAGDICVNYQSDTVTSFQTLNTGCDRTSLHPVTSTPTVIKVAEFATEKAISANVQKQQKRQHESTRVQIHQQPENIAVNIAKRRKIIRAKKYNNCKTKSIEYVEKDNTSIVNTDEHLNKNSSKVTIPRSVANGCIDPLSELARNDGATYPDFAMLTAADVEKHDQPLYINTRLTADILVPLLSGATDYEANTIVGEEDKKEAVTEDNKVPEVQQDMDKDFLTVLTFRRETTSSSVLKSLESSECLNLSSIAKSIPFYGNVLNSLSNERFCELLRVNRNEFAKLLSLIRDDVGFTNPLLDNQYSVELQLALVLCRLSTWTENATIRNIESIFGIANINVEKITKTVFQAILKLMPKYIYWPNNEERFKIIKDTYSELPMCIGYVDAMEIKLAKSKVHNHEEFNSIKAQIVCDHKLKIRNVVVGNIGNCQDEDIFKNCALSKNKSKFFNHNEWIAGDSAYQSTNNVITPYPANSKQLSESKRKIFNMRHRKYRVRVEHCFGLLREKFASLNDLEMCIKDKESHKFCCEWVLTCCVLYNILLSTKDVEKFTKHSLQQQLELEEAECSNANANEATELKRRRICNIMFEN